MRPNFTEQIVNLTPGLHGYIKLYSYNLLLPVGILVALIFALLVETGTSGSGEEQSFMDKIESSDSYSALLWGTMATAWLTLILYLLQITIRKFFFLSNSYCEL